MRSSTTCFALPLLVLAAAGSALAGPPYPITTLVLEGDSVPGVGLITRIDNIAVNDGGTWLVEADTDHANADADSVLLRDGSLYLREGDAVPPTGASIDTFDSVTLNNAGDCGFNFFLSGTGGSNDDSGVYWNTTLVWQEGDPAPGFPPATPLIGFFDVKINNANQLAVVASIDDPNIPTTVDRALYLLDLDGSGGLTGYTIIAKEGDVLTGQTESVQDFATGPHQSAINDNGDFMFFADLTGSTSTDGTIYLNDNLLAQEGRPSPVLGRNWSSLSGPELDLNDSGDYVFSGTLDGDTTTNLLIVKNGAKFRQEGDTLPAIGGLYTFTSFGSGPIEISDDGDVLWYGDWNNPDTDVDTGLFLNDTLLVQEGVTTINDVVVDTLRGITDGYHMSPGGHYIIFEAILADGNEGAFLITLPAACGDFDGDGDVDLDDFGSFAACFNGSARPPAGTCPPGVDADCDGDGDVDMDDFAIFAANFTGSL